MRQRKFIFFFKDGSSSTGYGLNLFEATIHVLSGRISLAKSTDINYVVDEHGIFGEVELEFKTSGFKAMTLRA